MNEMTFYKFFKEWFTNLKEHIFKVNVVNPDKSLEKRLNELAKAVDRLPGMAVTVLNQKDFNTKSVEDKLSNVILALQSLPQPDNSNVVEAVKGLSSALDKIKKVEVVNQKEVKMPKEMAVSGEVKVSNFPKEQKVTGEVKLSDFKELIGGFQAVVDTLNDLKLSMAQDMKNFGGVIIAGQTGGRSASSSGGAGDASAANQQTIIGHIDGIESTLSSVLSALQGTLTVTGGGGGIQYTEGDTDASITGTAALVEGAANALAVLTQPLTDTQLRAADVKITLDGESVPVTNAGITTIAGAVSGTEMQVDVLTLPNVTIGAAIPAGTNNIGDVDVASIAAGDNNIGNVDVVTVPSDPFGANADAAATAGSTGSMQAKLRLMTSQLDSIKTAVETLDNTVGGSELQVDVVGALPAGTNAIGKLAANSGVDIGDVDVTSLNDGGNSITVDQSTHDNFNANANIQVGNADVSVSNAVPVKNIPADIDINGSNANHADKYYTNAGAVTDGIIWSPAAGKRWHVTLLTINVSAACTVTIEDDLAGGDVVRNKFEFAANGGIVIPYGTEHPFSSAEDAADLIITTSAGNVYVQAVGYEV